MTNDTIALNIKRLRKERNLTQAQAAEKSGITRVAFRNIETGKSNPRADTLRSIASVLEVNVQALVTPVERLENVRFRARRRLNIRDGVLAEVSRRLQDYNDLEQILGQETEYQLAKVAAGLSKERPGADRARSAAEKVREKLHLKDSETIRDICGLLQDNDRAGVKVLPISRASRQFFGLSIAEEAGGPAIVVNTWDRISVERWIFTAAHELGHLVLHQSTYDVDSLVFDEGEENEANVFAANFLMPEEVFWREWRETFGMDLVDRVLKVKRIFNVSYMTVLYRLSESKSLPTGKNIWSLFRTAYLRKFGAHLSGTDEPCPLAPECFSEPLRAKEPEGLLAADFVEDRLARLVRIAIEKDRITVSRGAEILGISISKLRDMIKDWLQDEPIPER